VLEPLLDPIDERIPDVELRNLSAAKVDAPHVLVIPDLQGPLGAEDPQGNILGNAWLRCRPFLNF
jgi:hypothetical protein